MRNKTKKLEENRNKTIINISKKSIEQNKKMLIYK